MDSANPNIGKISLTSTIDTWQFLTVTVISTVSINGGQLISYLANLFLSLSIALISSPVANYFLIDYKLLLRAYP
jgi:hypothetical protein